MKELYFDPEWNYRQVKENLRTLRTQYWGILASFYYFDIKEVVKFKKKTRDTIYSYNFNKNPKENEKLHDLLWEYMNYFENINNEMEE